jgi:hypothetical protein
MAPVGSTMAVAFRTPVIELTAGFISWGNCIGYNVPQEALQLFAEAVVEVDRY